MQACIIQKKLSFQRTKYFFFLFLEETFWIEFPRLIQRKKEAWKNKKKYLYYAIIRKLLHTYTYMYKVDILETKTSTMHKEQIILGNKTKTASKTVAQLHSCEAFFNFFFI